MKSRVVTTYISYIYDVKVLASMLYQLSLYITRNAEDFCSILQKIILLGSNIIWLKNAKVYIEF